MKILQWFTKSSVQPDKTAWPVTQMSKCGLNNESYRNALQQFLNRRQSSEDGFADVNSPSYQSSNQNVDCCKKDNNKKRHNDWRLKNRAIVPGVSHVRSSEIFEIGYVPGTKDRYLKLVSAEWQNTKVSVKRYSRPKRWDAIKADIEVLTEIRHPNVLLLMATTYTNEHGLMSIFEPIDCTLYNYMHEQGERISLQGIAQSGMKLADALKYCHMRGYIHGAISSHCVYLTSNGSLKLGGWELAIKENNNSERDYEDHLRKEIFKWQAPEFFYGLNPSKKSDVYGLALLLWEMCTLRVPWNGCNQPHVQRQYTNQKRGITVDLRNFPPLLHNLLETGLQLDAAKRLIDMDRIRKTLRRLLMIYEEEEATYINEYGNNNNEEDTYILSIARKSSVSSLENTDLIKNSSNQLHCLVPEKKSNQFLVSKKIQCNKDLDLKSDAKETNAFSIENNNTLKSINETENFNHCACEKISNTIPNSNTIKDCKNDEESYNSVRSDLKRLKEALASKREHFFYGNESSLLSYQNLSPNATSTLLSQKSNSSVSWKPASHTTNIEPKQNSSYGEYEGVNMKSSYEQRRKIPYMGMSACNKSTILQSQYSNRRNHYERTLWGKEKSICLSKMGRDYKEQEKILSMSPPPPGYIVSKIDVDKHRYSNADSTQDNDTIKTLTESSADKSIQDLENALNRATEIVRSTTSYDTSLYSKNSNFEYSTDNMQKPESVFEELYETKYDSNQEMKVIERSTPGNREFLGMKEELFDQTCMDLENYKPMGMKKCIYDSTAKISNDFQISTQRQLLSSQETVQSTVEDYVITNKITIPRETKITENGFEFCGTESIKVDSDSVLSKNTVKMCSFQRRRSLPAILNPLKIMNNLKKLHAPKKNGQDSENTEDLYIDDEFGSNLNDNLVLLDESSLHRPHDDLYNDNGIELITGL